MRRMARTQGKYLQAMLAEICRYAIVGHSERRSIFGETDEAVNLKVRAALGVGMTPILCIGESLDERNGGDAESVVESQAIAGLEGVEVGSGVVVAYEPVWAIGTGQSASPEIAQAMMAHIRGTLAAILAAKCCICCAAAVWGERQCGEHRRIPQSAGHQWSTGWGSES